jgi:methylmalonyl-CoA/ethylmalonyl-CoA epimerase
VASEKVETAFFLQNGGKIELVQSTQTDGVIAKYIDKKGEGMHHIAFEVPDILVEMERLKKEGFTLLNETPKKGADNKLVCFVHPKDSNGVLIELCQTIV